MGELSTYGTAPQRGAQYVEGNGAEGDGVEYYLNEDQGIVIIGYSKAPNAQVIRRMMIAVFKAIVSGGMELTADQALDRLADCDTPSACPRKVLSFSSAVPRCSGQKPIRACAVHSNPGKSAAIMLSRGLRL